MALLQSALLRPLTCSLCICLKLPRPVYLGAPAGAHEIGASFRVSFCLPTRCSFVHPLSWEASSAADQMACWLMAAPAC